MTTVKHSTFTLERHYPVPPAKVFAAWADPAAKAGWFGAGDHTMDFRVGGRETNRSGDVEFIGEYHDIVEAERIVYAGALSDDEGLATVSITTVELVPDGSGTRLVLTEQGTFLDGREEPAWREQGTGDWLDKLGTYLGT